MASLTRVENLNQVGEFLFSTKNLHDKNIGAKDLRRRIRLITVKGAQYG
jgi:hypothetical protein